MQKPWIALIVLGTFYFFGCQSAKKQEVVPIVFDDWWNVDYVKNGCQLSAQWSKEGVLDSKPCPAEITAENVVKDFEDQVQLEFSTEAACHGLTITHFTPEMVHAALSNPAAPATGSMKKMAEQESWSLILELDGHSYNQIGRSWTLVSPTQTVLNGTITTSNRMAQEICKAAKGIGGKVE